MIHKFARFRVRHDKLAEALVVIEEFVSNVGRKEGGTALYRSLQETDDPTRFTHYMVFRTKAAEDNHRKTPWVKAFVEKLYPMCSEEPVFVELKPIGER